MSNNGPKPEGPESLTISVDSRQFSREAALTAAYWFAKDLFIEFPPSKAEHSFEILIRLRDLPLTLENPVGRPLHELASEFQNALVDSELRIIVQRETSAIRELLLAKAFSEAGVLESSPPPGSFNDPVLTAYTETSRDNLVVIDSSRAQDKIADRK